MTFLNVPDVVRSDTAGVTPPTAPRVAAIGNAEVTFRPDGDRLTVTLDVGAHMVVTNEQAARDLYACLKRVFDPLGETQSAVRQVAVLAGDAR